jgi:hypothetical protein
MWRPGSAAAPGCPVWYPPASGDLLLGEWHSPDLWVFDTDGSKRLALKLDRGPTAFPETKKAEYMANLKKSEAKNPGIGNQFLKDLEKKGDFFPTNLPYYLEYLPWLLELDTLFTWT